MNNNFVENIVMQRYVSPLIGILLASVMLSGCVTRPAAPVTPPPDSSSLYRDALQALDAGQKEKGLQLLDASARANPASAMPWVKLAAVHFDADNYPAAIEAADEAMKRDPARRDAKAIAVVASLRVAVRALSEMSADTNLRGNTRSEAERLARSLRETLGQDELVPLAEQEEYKDKDKAKRTPPRPSSASAASKPAPAPAPAAAAPQAPKPAAGAAANPFSILK